MYINYVTSNLQKGSENLENNNFWPCFNKNLVQSLVLININAVFLAGIALTLNSVTLNYFTVLIASPKKNMRKANNNANFFYNMRPAFGRNVAHRPHTLCSFILFF